MLQVSWVFSLLYHSSNETTYLDTESCIWVDVWQREKICRPDEEVSVEGVQGQTASAADPHHRLEPDLPGQVTSARYNNKMLMIIFKSKGY
jgi:hypothetical protein